MKKRTLMALVGVTIALAASACTSMQEKVLASDLREEQKNGAQFASWQHMGYSLFRATPSTTTKQDLAAAQQEKWWGQVVPVPPAK